jgi:hypothetical protein
MAPPPTRPGKGVPTVPSSLQAVLPIASIQNHSPAKASTRPSVTQNTPLPSQKELFTGHRVEQGISKTLYNLGRMIHNR